MSSRRVLSTAPLRPENPAGTRVFRGRGLGIVGGHAALPDLGPAPRRSTDRGRRVRFVIYTAILVALICVVAAVLSPSTGGHHQRRRSSAPVAWAQSLDGRAE
jgi:hypothetical protein